MQLKPVQLDIFLCSWGADTVSGLWIEEVGGANFGCRGKDDLRIYVIQQCWRVDGRRGEKGLRREGEKERKRRRDGERGRQESKGRETLSQNKTLNSQRELGM